MDRAHHAALCCLSHGQWRGKLRNDPFTTSVLQHQAGAGICTLDYTLKSPGQID